MTIVKQWSFHASLSFGINDRDTEIVIICCRGHVFLCIGICNFTASTSCTTWKLVPKRSQASKQQNIRRNDASKKSQVVTQLAAVVISTPSISCEVIYLFTFLAEPLLRSWISRDILWLICRLICWVLEALVDSFGLLSAELHTRSLPVPLTV